MSKNIFMGVLVGLIAHNASAATSSAQKDARSIARKSGLNLSDPKVQRRIDVATKNYLTYPQQEIIIKEYDDIPLGSSETVRHAVTHGLPNPIETEVSYRPASLGDGEPILSQRPDDAFSSVGGTSLAARRGVPLPLGLDVGAGGNKLELAEGAAIMRVLDVGSSSQSTTSARSARLQLDFLEDRDSPLPIGSICSGEENTLETLMPLAFAERPASASSQSAGSEARSGSATSSVSRWRSIVTSRSTLRLISERGSSSRASQRPPLLPTTGVTYARLARSVSLGQEELPLRTPTPIGMAEETSFNVLLRGWIMPRAQAIDPPLTEDDLNKIQSQAFAAVNTSRMQLWYFLGTGRLEDIRKAAQVGELTGRLAASNIDMYTLMPYTTLERIGISIGEWENARIRAFSAFKSIWDKLKPTFDQDVFKGTFSTVLEAAALALAYSVDEIQHNIRAAKWSDLMADPGSLFPPKPFLVSTKKIEVSPEEIEFIMARERRNAVVLLIADKKWKGDKLSNAIGACRDLLPHEQDTLETLALAARGISVDQLYNALEALPLHKIWEERSRLFTPIEIMTNCGAGAASAPLFEAETERGRGLILPSAVGYSMLIPPLINTSTNVSRSTRPLPTPAGMVSDPTNIVFSPPVGRIQPPVLEEERPGS